MKKNVTIKKEDLAWVDFNDVLKRALKKNGVKAGYLAEMKRVARASQLRALRVKKHLTQSDVAKIAEMPQSVVARIESGERGMNVETLDRIASVYGMSLELV